MLSITHLQELDAEEWAPITATDYVAPANRGSYASPHRFVAEDGERYWLKWKAQQGLVSELVAGRLAALLNAGPDAKVITVPRGVFQLTGDAKNLEGTVVGIRHIQRTENARYADKLGSISDSTVDVPSRSRAIVFQTWLQMSDPQVLVETLTGRIYSIDHGDAFKDVNSFTDPTPVITSIPNVSDELGKERRYILNAVSDIENLTDTEILRSVAKVPNDNGWKAGEQRRYQIYKWLAHRRDRLREVMKKWLQT